MDLLDLLVTTSFASNFVHTYSIYPVPIGSLGQIMHLNPPLESILSIDENHIKICCVS